MLIGPYSSTLMVASLFCERRMESMLDQSNGFGARIACGLLRRRRTLRPFDELARPQAGLERNEDQSHNPKPAAGRVRLGGRECLAFDPGNYRGPGIGELAQSRFGADLGGHVTGR